MAANATVTVEHIRSLSHVTDDTARTFRSHQAPTKEVEFLLTLDNDYPGTEGGYLLTADQLGLQAITAVYQVFGVTGTPESGYHVRILYGQRNDADVLLEVHTAQATGHAANEVDDTDDLSAADPIKMLARGY